jgi:hypothetical protein
VRASAGAPGRSQFTADEWRLVRRLSTPAKVQAYLNALPYNTETRGESLRSFRGVVAAGTAHCFEAAMFAAVVLEQHGYPPLMLSFESIDHLDHVLFVYSQNGKWGSVARSRDPGLHGRKPVFKTPRALALSYVDAYVDYTGGVRAYAVADMRAMDAYDWRFNRRYVWPAEQYLLDYPHRSIKTDRARIADLRRRYRQFRKRHDDMKPVDYKGREKWTPIPTEFRAAEPFPFDGPTVTKGNRKTTKAS